MVLLLWIIVNINSNIFAGVGGPRCSACLAGYWGMSPSGCTKCKPCTQPGHVCDPDTGTNIHR